MFLTGINEWRAPRRVAAEGGAAADALPRRGRAADDRRADGERGQSAFDEYVSDPNRPVPYLGYVVGGMTRRLHDRGSALRRAAPRRARLRDRAARRGRRSSPGPIKVEPQRLDHGHRRRLRRQAHRRLPRRLPDAAPRPRGSRLPPNAVRMGGYQQLVRGEPFRGKFRNSFEKPEPFTPGQARRDRLRAARRLPRLPPRPPHDGAGAELVVPARRPQPAEVHGDPEGDAPPTSRRPRTASTARARSAPPSPSLSKATRRARSRRANSGGRCARARWRAGRPRRRPDERAEGGEARVLREALLVAVVDLLRDDRDLEAGRRRSRRAAVRRSRPLARRSARRPRAASGCRASVVRPKPQLPQLVRVVGSTQ